MTARTKARLRLVLLVLVAFVVQTTVGADLRVQQVAPDLMLVAAICAGLTGGARQGMLIGFAAGLLSDMSLTDTPVGLSALALCVTGYAVGALRENVLPEGWVLTPVLALVTSAAGVVLFLAVGDIVGQTQLVAMGRSGLIRTVTIESAWSAALSVPAAWLFARAGRGTEGAAALDRGRPDRLGVR